MIDDFSDEITVTRDTKTGKYVLGEYVEGSQSQFKTLACVQPMQFDELLLLPEGERTKEALKIYLEAELFTVDETCQRKADIITYFGKLYEVHKVERWTQLIPHFKVIAVNRNKPDPGE